MTLTLVLLKNNRVERRFEVREEVPKYTKKRSVSAGSRFDERGIERDKRSTQKGGLVVVAEHREGLFAYLWREVAVTEIENLTHTTRYMPKSHIHRSKCLFFSSLLPTKEVTKETPQTYLDGQWTPPHLHFSFHFSQGGLFLEVKDCCSVVAARGRAITKYKAL